MTKSGDLPALTPPSDTFPPPASSAHPDAFVRFSFATSMAVIEEGMARIKQALAALV